MWAQRATDLSEEFIIHDSAIMVAVEGSEEQLILLGAAVQLVVSKSLRELIVVETSGSVVVHDAELSSESENWASSSGCQNLPDSRYEPLESTVSLAYWSSGEAGVGAFLDGDFMGEAERPNSWAPNSL